MYVAFLFERQTTRKKQLAAERQPMTTLFLLLRTTRSSQCCRTDMLRMTVLNSSRDENRWPTCSPEYISVILAGRRHSTRVEQPCTDAGRGCASDKGHRGLSRVTMGSGTRGWTRWTEAERGDKLSLASSSVQCRESRQPPIMYKRCSGGDERKIWGSRCWPDRSPSLFLSHLQPSFTLLSRPLHNVGGLLF